MIRVPTIAIAGAGLGGLVAALLLARSGFRVLLFERERVPSTFGAGIQITPNAGRILASLGVDGKIAERSSQPRAIQVRSGRSGRRIVTMPLGDGFARGFGLPYRTIHRADLHGILVEAATSEPGVELLLGHAVVEFADHPRGLTVMTETSEGDVEFEASALIAADGVGSAIRKLIPDSAERIETGRVAWRAVIGESDLPRGIPADSVGLWLGSSGHLVHYPVRSGREINVVAVIDQPDAESGRPNADRVRQRFRRWARPARELVGVDAPWQCWPISSVNPTAAWTTDRVGLIGDAAHAMVPYLAQGGAMAIEDAAEISRAIVARPADIAGAMSAYETARRSRVRRVWRAAETTADLYHMGLLTGAVRNAGMRFLGGRALLNRYGWIYRWQPDAGNERRRPKAAPSSP